MNHKTNNSHTSRSYSGGPNNAQFKSAAILSEALFAATAAALARRKQVNSILTRHTFGLRWKLPK